VSAVFRQVCHGWQEAHDPVVTVLKPNTALQDAHVWRKFGGVKTLDLCKASSVNDDDVGALAQLISLNSLSLGGHHMNHRGGNQLVPTVTDEGMWALSPLTSLTFLDLSYCEAVTHKWISTLAPLINRTSLSLQNCKRVSDKGLRALSPLTALTSLKLGSCNIITNKRVTALAPLTTLTSLDLSRCERLGGDC
jgi:hypothetical protein